MYIYTRGHKKVRQYLFDFADYMFSEPLSGPLSVRRLYRYSDAQIRSMHIFTIVTETFLTAGSHMHAYPQLNPSLLFLS